MIEPVVKRKKKKKPGVFISSIPFTREKLLSIITIEPWKQCKETYQDPNEREIKWNIVLFPFRTKMMIFFQKWNTFSFIKIFLLANKNLKMIVHEYYIIYIKIIYLFP